MAEERIQLAEDEVELLDRLTFASTDPARPGEFDTVVLYLDSQRRQGTVVIPGKEPSDEEIMEAIREAQGVRKELRGRILKIS